VEGLSSQGIESYQIVMEFCGGAFQEDEYEFGCYWPVSTIREQFLMQILSSGF
jgi:hypothetical protein